MLLRSRLVHEDEHGGYEPPEENEVAKRPRVSLKTELFEAPALTWPISALGSVEEFLSSVDDLGFDSELDEDIHTEMEPFEP